MIMTYWKVKLIIKDKLHKTELFETLSEARLWAMEEAKLSVSHFMFNKTDIVADITSHEFA
jgi:hypothetical protein|tara:strand:+ start:530 stop:712 length:183 start_codon:yes stop_codon:yes gene_type:complete